MLDAATPEAIIRDIVDAYVGKNAYADSSAEERSEAILEHFEDNARIIGNAPGEDWSEKAGVREQLAYELGTFRGLEETFSTDGWVSVAHHGRDLAITTLTGHLEGAENKESFAHRGRWTCVLRKTDETWRVAFSHFTTT